MGNIVPNIALGRVAELYNRVDSNDPTNAALVVALFSGAISDANIRDLDDIAAIEGHADAAECVLSGYARKSLVDSDLTAWAPDDSGDKVLLTFADQTWTAVAAGTAITRLVVAYDSDTTGGADSGIVPLTVHDFAVTPDGSDITADIGAGGFYQATSAA